MKVLLISHNPVSKNQNMGKTILTLFSDFKPEELCQFYIYPSIPDAEACTSFYRITDKDILKSYYRVHVSGKRVAADPENGELFEKPIDQKLYRQKNNHAAWKCLLRDDMWKHAKWYNSDLKKWLGEQKPTVIFVAPGRAKFLYNIAIQLSNSLSIPIITYLCDNFYFTKSADKFIERRYQYLLKKKIEELMQHTQKCITICDSMKESYASCFDIPFQTIMTASSRPIAQKIKQVEQPLNLIYMGNIRCGRYQSLADIGRELDIINREGNTTYQLKIYSGEKNPDILKAFDGIKSIQLCGFVTGEKFDQIFLGADVLLHVESFAPEDIDRVRYSISTKIADTLSSGISLFAYGPEDVASIQYIQKERCGIVCTEHNKLNEALLTLLNSRECRENAAQNGLRAAAIYHNPGKNKNMVRRIFTEAEVKRNIISNGEAS